MRAVLLPALHSRLVDAEFPEPPLGANDVRVAIAACGICHSDAHYRAGFGAIATPRILGHEIAGRVVEVGASVSEPRVGDRVAVHYLRSCGACRGCERGEQFCETGEMIGKQCDGGYAESIVIPARNAVAIPDNVPFEIAAVMMCSTATAYHALRVGGFEQGKSVAILGLGGLGISALHLCRVLGASHITTVDVVEEKLAAAEALGARRGLTQPVDIAVDFTGRPDVMLDALKMLEPRGSLVVVALSEAPFTLNPYRDLLGKERRIVGCSDHLRSELVELMELASTGKLEIGGAISRRVPLQAGDINDALDDLERGTAILRNVMVNA